MKRLKIPVDPFVREYSPLIGKTVESIALDDTDSSVYGLKFNDGTVAWILQDPEGNGSGFLNII